MQILVQSLRIGLCQVLIRENTLHYVLLILLLDESTFYPQALVSIVFADRVAHLLHPNALLPLLQVTSHFQISVDRCQFAHLGTLVGGIWHSEGGGELAVQCLAIILLYEVFDDLFGRVDATVHTEDPLHFE